MTALSRLGLAQMTGRDPHEKHRVASSLELFFDLVFVVAVSQAAQSLHHGIGEGRVWETSLAYAMVFFAIWWAWMNFTWFASAFDTDDWLYRVTTIVQMGGVLLLATGVHDAMMGDWRAGTWGYVIMRLAMVAQWVRLALSDPEQRQIALRYAVGIGMVQLLWVGRLVLTPEAQFWTFWPAMVLELLVPVLAERSRRTPWHPNHIAERCSLFALIVLAESLLASSNAIIDARNTGDHAQGLVTLAIAGLIIAAGMWWIYFALEQGERLRANTQGFFFGYAHYLVFASAGAVSVGIAVELDLLTGDTAHLTASVASFVLTVPITLFMVTVWFIMLRGRIPQIASVLFLLAALAVLACALLPTLTVVGAAACVAAAVAVLEVWAKR